MRAFFGDQDCPGNPQHECSTSSLSSLDKRRDNSIVSQSQNDSQLIYTHFRRRKSSHCFQYRSIWKTVFFTPVFFQPIFFFQFDISIRFLKEKIPELGTQTLSRHCLLGQKLGRSRNLIVRLRAWPPIIWFWRRYLNFLWPLLRFIVHTNQHGNSFNSLNSYRALRIISYSHHRSPQCTSWNLLCNDTNALLRLIGTIQKCIWSTSWSSTFHRFTYHQINSSWPLSFR